MIIGELFDEFHSGKSIKNSDISSVGKYPVFGGNGVRGYTNTFNQDGSYVIIGRQGAYCGNVRYYTGKAFLTEHAIVGKTKKEYNHVAVAYLLSLLDLHKYQGQSAQPGLSVDTLSRIPITLPNSNIDGIGQILSALDAKTALNRRMNEELERMAKELYDYWFVKFDFPNEEGKPYKSSGGAMDFNTLLKRPIPSGWEIENLFNCVNVLYGYPFSTELFVEEPIGKPVVRIRDILSGTTSAFSIEDVDDKYKLEKSDVVIGMDGNFHMNIWHNNTDYLNQRCVRLRVKENSPLSAISIFYAVQPYIKHREQTITGSIVGHLSDADLKKIFLVVPNLPFDKVRPIFDSIAEQITNNRVEIEHLTALRDKLLPLLMNGQVKVAD